MPPSDRLKRLAGKKDTHMSLPKNECDPAHFNAVIRVTDILGAWLDGFNDGDRAAHREPDVQIPQPHAIGFGAIRLTVRWAGVLADEANDELPQLGVTPGIQGTARGFSWLTKRDI